MFHRRVKHCHRPLDPARPVGAIPMIRRHTISRIPRSPSKEKVESLDFAAEEDNGFPCFCMRCEKEFIPRDHQLLYCSQGNLNQEGHPVVVTPPQTSSKIPDNLPFYSAAPPKPRDIVPCALPSRPVIGFPTMASDLQARSINNVTTAASSVTSESLLYT